MGNGGEILPGTKAVNRPAMSANDETFMGAALELARTVRGRTGDNPPVGCVIVKEGNLFGRGATQSPGGPHDPGGSHAEVMAIGQAEAAGHSVSGADLFVILEPCAFTGRTPPCAALIVEKKLRRVVVAIRDPHPQVRGAGIAALQAAGIQVTEGVLEGPVRELLADWLKRYQEVRGAG